MKKNKQIKSGRLVKKPSANRPQTVQPDPSNPVFAAERRALAAAERLRPAPWTEPDIIVRDRGGAQVSAFGQDQGPLPRDVERDAVIDADGNRAWAARVRSGIMRMHQDHIITAMQLEAGLDFQRAFDAAGYRSCRTTNLSGANGGSCGPEDVMAGSADARQRVRDYLVLVRYPQSAMGKAVFWMLGHGLSMDEMARSPARHGIEAGAADKAFWRGSLVAALELMGHDYQRRIAARRRMRVHADPADMPRVPEGGYPGGIAGTK